MPVFPGCQDRNWMLWWPALVSGIARNFDFIDAFHQYRFGIEQPVSEINGYIRVHDILCAHTGAYFATHSASACAFTTTVISTVLLKGVKCPVITHVPLTSSRAELNILPGSYSWYHSTFFTQPHQGLLAVLMQLCAPFRGADGSTYDSSTRLQDVVSVTSTP